MKKIENFTKKRVKEIRLVIHEVESQIERKHIKGSDTKNKILVEELKVKLEIAGEDFLKLEKYVNLNYTGFHKILKKHDRRFVLD